jgi:hypothetical protein
VCGETADINKASAQKPELFLVDKTHDRWLIKGGGLDEIYCRFYEIEQGINRWFVGVHKRKRRPLFMRDERKAALEIISQE